MAKNAGSRTLKDFEELWREINKAPSAVVQERTELEFIFNKMKSCETYLEVGSAEGKSLYVLAQAMPKGSEITYIDLGEKHTSPERNEWLKKLTDYKLTEILGNSNSFRSYLPVKDQKFDAVFIDAGHDLFSVLVDACWYGLLAKKFVFFHDVTIPAVDFVFQWFSKNIPNEHAYKVINSETYGYGVIEL